MTTYLRIVLIILTLIYLFLIAKSIKYKKLNISFSMFWFVTGILLIVALIFPNTVTWLSSALGFQMASNMLFCLTIFLAFYLIFKLTINLSKAYDKNIKLAQELSILKQRVNKIEEKDK